MLPKLKTLIVDDIQTHRETLLHLLSKYAHVFNIHTVAPSFAVARDILAQESFDLSILDIKLDRGKDVLDLIGTINRNHFGIISITSEHLAELPRRGLVIDSPILFGKPYDSDLIGDFVVRVLERWEKVINNKESRFVIVSGAESISILRRRIYFFEANRSITKVCFEVPVEENPKRYLFRDHHQPFSKVEEELRDSSFIKCHRSFLVNTMYDLKCKRENRGVRILFRSQDNFSDSKVEVEALASEPGKELLISLGFLREYGS